MSENPYEEWCRRIKHSDREAFAELFHALHDALYRYAISITGDRVVAGDLLQDVFVQLWERRHTLEPGRSLKGLLYRMTRNASYNQQRDRRRRRELLRKEMQPLDGEAPTAPDALLGADRLNARLRVWIDELPERQREALLLSRYQGLSHEEIAGVMGISPRTVNNHLVKALKTLRDRIRAFEPDLIKS